MQSLNDLTPGARMGCRALAICPLNSVRAGSSVRIRRLVAEVTVCQRLREIGFCEDSTVRLIKSQSTVVCQVCNARLAISADLAHQILVEPLCPAV
jgi:ferrous iron transport protein A